ncbi:hypothetical protein DTO169E5_9027 [Paecilomyces variotii]|nr:hypothetical protein DTO169E5_9027 [Paecilomyces variotii]
MKKRFFNIFSKPPPYKAVADEDTDDGHNESISEDSMKSNLLGYKLSRDETLSSPRRRLLLWLNVTLFTLSLFILMLSAILLSGIGRGRNAALKETSEYSPLLDRLDIPLTTWQMNATLLEPDPLPIYRQPPSPEVDRAWKRLANVNPIVVTREDVIKFGKDPDQAAKWPESFGFGDDAYIGRLDVFHQIHCLDWLRREAYFGHYFGKKWPPGTKPSDLHLTHLSHCIYLLLQNLMCNANVDVYTHYWADAQLNAFPDFNINHKCRDFDAILKWQEENSIDVDTFAEIRRPPEYEPRIMSHRFKELFGWYKTHEDDHFEGGEIG